MLDPAISSFFEDRKNAWLKKKLKPLMDESEIKEIQDECVLIFSLEQWLPHAAKRAGQISMATHPCTFSHPSARKNKNGYVSSVIAKTERINDGFLKTGSVDVETDALGNAAALDVYKFLTLTMLDGQQFLTHIQQDSALAKNTLKINTISYEGLKNNFLAMVTSAGENITSSKIKQVFFLVENDYHQLSILTNSGLIYQLRKRLDKLRFSDEVKELRDLKRKNEFSEHDFSEIYNLTTLGYGGTKPQNISVLNNQNGGKVHLLMSMPPELTQRDVQFPTVDFFAQSIRYFYCRSSFLKLHELYLTDKNNMHVRAKKDEYYQMIIDEVIEKMWEARSVAQEQYNSKYSRLNRHQKNWLLPEHQEFRENENEWFDKSMESVTQFIFHGDEKILAKKAIKFADGEYRQMAQIVEDNKESLR